MTPTNFDEREPCLVCGAPIDRHGRGHDDGCTMQEVPVLWECRVYHQCEATTHRLYTEDGKPWRECCKAHGQVAAQGNYGPGNGLVLEGVEPEGPCADCGSPDVVDESPRGAICQPCVDVHDMENARDEAERKARDWRDSFAEQRAVEADVARRRRDAAVAAAMANINRHKPSQL